MLKPSSATDYNIPIISPQEKHPKYHFHCTMLTLFDMGFFELSALGEGMVSIITYLSLLQ